jgi:hypothetical protein
MTIDRIILLVANCWIQIFISSIYQRPGIEKLLQWQFSNRQKPIDKPEKTTNKPFLLQYPLRFSQKSDRFCNLDRFLMVFQSLPAAYAALYKPGIPSIISMCSIALILSLSSSITPGVGGFVQMPYGFLDGKR